MSVIWWIGLIEILIMLKISNDACIVVFDNDLMNIEKYYWVTILIIYTRTICLSWSSSPRTFSSRSFHISRSPLELLSISRIAILWGIKKILIISNTQFISITWEILIHYFLICKRKFIIIIIGSMLMEILKIKPWFKY